MATAGSLVFNLIGNHKSLTQSLNVARSGIRSLGGSAMSGLSGVGSAFGSVAFGAAAAGAALVGVGSVAAGLGLGIKLAADAEQAQTAFAVFTGSSENAKKLLGEVRDFAASTPFELPQIRDAAQKMLGFGFATDQVLPNLRVLGDIASATGRDVGEFVQIFGKIKSTGKLTGETLNQLLEHSVPVIGELARQFHVPETAIQEMVSEGKVSFGDLQKAMVTLTGDGGLMAGMMAKQSQTLAGQWSNFKDSVGTALTVVGAKIISAFHLGDVVTAATGYLATFTGWIERGADAISNFVRENQGILKSVAQFAGLTLGIAAVVTGAIALGSTIVTVLGVIFSPIGLVVGAIAGIAAALVYAYGEGDTFGAKLQSIFSQIPPMLDALAFTFRNFSDVAQLALINIALAALSAFPEIEKPIQSLVAILTGLWAGAGAGFSAFFDNVISGFKEIGNVGSALVDGITAAWDAIMSGDITGAASAFGEKFTSSLAAQANEKSGGNPMDAFGTAFSAAQADAEKLFAGGGGLTNILQDQQQGILDRINQHEDERNKASETVAKAEAAKIADPTIDTKKAPAKAGKGEHVEALTAGSKEAYSAILAAQRGARNPGDKQLDESKKQTAAVEKQTVVLQSIDKGLTSRIVPVRLGG